MTLTQAGAAPETTEVGGRPLLRKWIWYAAILIVSAHFSLSYVGRQQSFLDLRTYTAGACVIPFQYRTLVAWIFRALVSNHFFLAVARHAPAAYHDPYLFASLLVSFLSLIGCVAATADTIKRLTGAIEFSRWSAFLVIYMSYFNLIMMYTLTYTLPYDLPSLFFFCVGINLILRNRMWIYYPVFVAAVFNRETVCFLTVFFAAWTWFQEESDTRRKVWKIMPHVLAQAAIWLAIKVYLYHLYLHNGADNSALATNRVFGNKLLYNLKEIVTPGQWPLFLSNFGFMAPLLIAQRRWIGSRPFARAALVVIALWICGMMYVGVIVEIRIFTELISLIAPLIALIVYHRFFQAPSLAGFTSPGSRTTFEE
jgi:hypothetical protein